MARTKASEKALKAQRDATLRSALESVSEPLSMSNKRQLDSPCPASSPQIKRPRNDFFGDSDRDEDEDLMSSEERYCRNFEARTKPQISNARGRESSIPELDTSRYAACIYGFIDCWPLKNVPCKHILDKRYADLLGDPSTKVLRGGSQGTYDSGQGSAGVNRTRDTDRYKSASKKRTTDASGNYRATANNDRQATVSSKNGSVGSDESKLCSPRDSTGTYTEAARQRLHELERDRCKAWVGTSSNKPPSRNSANTWHSFTVCVCLCSLVKRPISANVVPRTLVRSLSRLYDIVLDITNRENLAGHFTDLDGISLFSLDSSWEDYLACGLPGIIWHEQDGKHVLHSQEIADTELTNRLDADHRARTVQTSAQNNLQLNTSPFRRDSYPGWYGNSSDEEQVTPPPHRVTLKQEDEDDDDECAHPGRAPWTAMTSSSGRITQLDNSDLRSSIKRQPLRNVFDDSQRSPWGDIPLCLRLHEDGCDFSDYDSRE